MVLSSFNLQTAAVADVELRKMLRDPTELVSRAVQPVLWLAVFGQVMEQVRGIHSGPVSYLVFITPGILAQSVLFSAIFYGIAVIWERDLGVVHKLLVSPAYRSALVLGKALAAGFRGLVQAGVIYLLAALMHVQLRHDPFVIGVVLCTVVLGSAVFSTFSLIIACIVKTRERFMGVGQVLTMPLFFASSAIYPLDLMPPWLRAIARFNPLTYLVDALRVLMVPGDAPALAAWGLDALVLAGVFAVLLAVAVRLYPSLVR
ncbi:MAG TPA: ABC transporter permease [Usitatibacter sp.]|nr:ABC transporter permease [Usitatibacter sp.]